MEKDVEPPALKIRIFKGHSGELINDNEARQHRKRKKKIRKEKSKLAKLAIEKGIISKNKYSFAQLSKPSTSTKS